MNATEEDHEARLLALVVELAAEARAQDAREIPRSLDASFERDYGFDSLTRMELIHRVERSFGVTFAERALAEMETPRDVLREIAGAPFPPPAIIVSCHCGSFTFAPRAAQTKWTLSKPQLR